MQRRLLLSWFFIGCATFAPAQDELVIPDVKIPALAHTGKTAADFTPPGWMVQIQAAGDLNGDGLPDLAFVLHDTDRRNIIQNRSGFGVDSLDTNPRILAIALHNATGDAYALALQNSTLIPRYEAPNLDDNFDTESDDGALTIARGAFTVSLHYFANAGSWDTGNASLTFRLQNNRFELIGFSNENLHRGTGIETDTSANYSTGKLKIVKGSDTTPTRTVWKPLKSARHLTIDQVGDGMEFQPR